MNIIDYSLVAKKIEQLIKKKIVDEGLVKTGKLLNSIKVIVVSNNKFAVEAEDYYVYLDDEYKITESVFNSQELHDFIENEMFKSIEKEINKIQ